MLIATVGLAVVLEEIIRMASGSRELWMEPVFNAPLRLTDADAGFEARTTPIRLATLGICAGLVGGLLYFLKRAPFGRLWRAVSEDAAMARLLGVDVDRVISRSVVIASLYAGTAGALMAVLYGNASFHGGLAIGLKALYIAILGGLTSPVGALLGALALGTFETAWSTTFDATYRDVASFTVMTLLLILRPGGIAGDPLKKAQV
jgi:branched-chain amino acid transport system permease protein